MVGSIDPRCETVRGTHWPKKGRVVDWSSRRGSHLGQRFKPPHQQAGHMDASDPIRPQKTLAARGPSTYGSRLSLRVAGTTRMFVQKICVRILAAQIARGLTERLPLLRTEGAGKAGCPMHP